MSSTILLRCSEIQYWTVARPIYIIIGHFAVLAKKIVPRLFLRMRHSRVMPGKVGVYMRSSTLFRRFLLQNFRSIRWASFHVYFVLLWKQNLNDMDLCVSYKKQALDAFCLSSPCEMEQSRLQPVIIFCENALTCIHYLYNIPRLLNNQKQRLMLVGRQKLLITACQQNPELYHY